MYYRYDADDLMYEILNDIDEIVCKAYSEDEAKRIIKENE